MRSEIENFAYGPRQLVPTNGLRIWPNVPKGHVILSVSSEHPPSHVSPAASLHRENRITVGWSQLINGQRCSLPWAPLRMASHPTMLHSTWPNHSLTITCLFQIVKLQPTPRLSNSNLELCLLPPLSRICSSFISFCFFLKKIISIKYS